MNPVLMAGNSLKSLLSPRSLLGIFTCSVLAFLLSPSSIWPCGPGEPDPLRIFRPLQITAALYPDQDKNEYYAVLDRLAGTCDAPEGDAYLDKNVDDWSRYLKARAGFEPDRKSLDSLIYKTSPEEIQKALNGKGNSLQAKLASKGQKDVLQYLLYAKTLEPLVLPPESYWDNEGPPAREKVEPFIQKGIKEAGSQKDRDLKIRYTYQAVRLAHYSGQFSRALSILEKASLKPTDPLYDRLDHLKAGALLKNKNTSQGLKVLARMSARSPELMLRVSLDFDRYWASEGAYDAAFASASREEKKALILLRFFSSPEPNLGLLKQMVEAFPKDPALDYMLIREMDRLEDRLETVLYYTSGYDAQTSARDKKGGAEDSESGFSISGLLMRIWNWFVPSLEAKPVAKIPPEEIQYMNQLVRFFGEVAEQKRTASPGTWKLAQSYLEMLMGKHSQASETLKHALVNPSESPFVRLQSKRIRLLNASAEKSRPDDELKNLVVQDYSSIVESDEPHYYGCAWSDHAARLMLHRNMVKLHSQAQESGRALLWEPNISSSLETYEFQALEQAEQLRNQPQNDYDRKLKEIAQIQTEQIVYRLGARQLKLGQYGEAVKALGRLPEKKRKNMYYSERIVAGPFSNPFSDRFDSGKKAEDFNSYTIAVRMQELEKQASKETGNKAARAYYEMGLAQFNMSHFGHWWSAVDEYWSIYYDYSEKPGDPQLKLARSYFEKSIANAKDRELVAASRFMIATIAYLDSAQGGYYTEDSVNLVPDQKVQFEKLSELDDTEFYSEVVRSCTYFMMYRQ